MRTDQETESRAPDEVDPGIQGTYTAYGVRSSPTEESAEAGKAALDGMVSLKSSSRPALGKVVLVSGLGLFVELLLIRWLDSQVRPLAFVKNLPLIASFLGLGLGYASPDRFRRLVPASGLLLAMVLFAGLASDAPGGGTVAFGPVGAEVNLGAAPMSTRLELIAFVGALVGVFAAVALATFPLGQLAARAMKGLETLPAYTANVAGSLLGVLSAFVLASASIPLWVNAAVAFLLLTAVLEGSPAARVGTLAAGLVISLVMAYQDHPSGQRFRLWSPYNRIEVSTDPPLRTPDGTLVSPGYSVFVQSLFHQRMLALSPERWPQLSGLLSRERAHYDFPYRLLSPQRVLILGAGTGNDIAAALRNGARVVDAVEIDPMILAVGRKLHPDRPMQDPRVRPIVADARAVLERPGPAYDLIVFGTLDAHLGFYSSIASSIRLDNYVYTVESLRRALARLTPGGAVYANVYIEFPWVATRLQRMIEEAGGVTPLTTSPRVEGENASYLFGPVTRSAGVAAARLVAGFSAETLQRNPPGPSARDDWPFLYLRSRRVPPVILLSGALVLGAGFLLVRFVIGGVRRLDRHFFFLGAGFLLVETRTIAQLALLFGTTWRVSAIAISAILAAVLLANGVVRQTGPLPRPFLYVGLAVSLLVGTVVPVGAALGAGSLAAWGMTLILALPVVFSSLVFSSSIADQTDLAPILASNLAGGVLGGLLENVSLVIGISALGFVALAVYAASYRPWLSSSA